MRGYVVVKEQLPYKVKSIPQGSVVVSEFSRNKTKPIPPSSINSLLTNNIQSKNVRSRDLTVLITKYADTITNHDTKKTKSIYVDKQPAKTWVVDPVAKLFYVDRQPSRNWVISTGRIDIPELEFSVGDIFVDAQTGKVFVFAGDVDSFQFVEIGYYADLCEETEYYESDTEPIDALFGDRWFDTSVGVLFTLVKNASDEDVWAQIGQPSGVCEGSDIFYGKTNPFNITVGELGDRWFDETTGAFYTYSNEPAANWIELE